MLAQYATINPFFISMLLCVDGGEFALNQKPVITWLFRSCVVIATLMAVYLTAMLAGYDLVAGIAEQIRIACAPKAENIYLVCSNSKDKVAIGETVTLTLAVAPSDAIAPAAVFSSSDDSVASVDENGVVTGKTLGKVTITATVEQAGSGQSTFQKEITVRLPEPKGVSVTCAENGAANAIVQWETVDDAIGYHVYRQLNGGPWERLTDTLTQETKFVDENTVDEGDHAYVVTAIAEEKGCTSKRSKTVMMSLLETPYGTKISNMSNDGIEFYWKRPAGAKGYEVFRSYSPEWGFEKIADIPERSIYTYIDNDFNTDVKRVYYRIRSYKLDANKQKVYSKISSVTEARYREHLKLENDEVILRSGAKRTLQAYMGWCNAGNIKWSSSDERVATINKRGTITAVSQGSCTITCYSRDTKEKRRCKVIVDRDALSLLSELTSVYTQKKDGMWVQRKSGQKDKAVLMMVGDMMCTGTQQARQGYTTGDYNFNESFAGVKDIISGADFAIGNLETMLSHTWPYMHEEAYVDNYANCNAPNRYLDAIRYAGFDGVVMSNNHNCDTGVQGTEETLEQVERYQLAHTGMYQTESDQRYLLVQVNGIKVGYLSYTGKETGFNDKNREEWNEQTIENRLNLYNPTKAKRDIAALREAGAEYIIVYMHWGVKNVYEPTENQEEDAKELANLGVDYIVGAHSHLIQKYTVIQADDGRSVPCFYSLGDFQGSIEQITGNRDSVILRISLERDENGNVVLKDNAYIPCYTLTEYQGMDFYTIIVLPELNGGVELDSFTKIRLRIVQSVGIELSQYTKEE